MKGRTGWLPAVFGGALLLIFGIAALQTGDRLRSAETDNVARQEARELAAEIQTTLLTISRKLEQQGAPLASPDEFRELVPGISLDLWEFDGNGLLTSSDSLRSDTAIETQLDGIDPPTVTAPVTTSTGRDLVFIVVPKDAGWVGASLPVDSLVGKRTAAGLSLSSLQLGWSDSEHGDLRIFAASRSNLSRDESLRFPVPGGTWQIAFNSQSQAQSNDMRWALYVFILLMSYALAVTLYRLSVTPGTIMLELETMKQRFIRLNENHNDLLASREKVQDRIHELSVTDAETGLPNRQALIEHAEAMFTKMRSEPGAGPMSIAIVGLRDVEKAQQSLGHSVIATVFPEVAQRLRNAMTDELFIARIANYQLAVLLPEHDENAATRFAADLSSGNLTGIYEHPQGRINVSPRFGIAVAKDGYSYAERLIDDGLSALSDAENSATRWSVYKSETRDDRLTMIQLESDFRSAIDNNEFRLHYQPIVHTHSGKPKGFECLVRWQHPVEGLLPPGRFIALGEATGLITELTRWALQEAVRQAAAWENLRKLDCYLSVNLSTLDLLYEPLARELTAMVNDAGLSPATFRLEITESNLIDNLAQARDMLIQLRDAGFGIMMDDFGTGFSSLSYLRQLPFSAIKIDRSFTQAITWDSKDYGMVRNILNLVHFLEMESIIEGVETDEQHELLMPLDPVYCQGYLFSKPLTAIDAEEYLAAATLADPAAATGT